MKTAIFFWRMIKTIDHTALFILPIGLVLGQHDLTSSSPFDLGSKSSVRVDQTVQNKVISFDKKTSGSLKLTAFPSDQSAMIGVTASGVFDFDTGDRRDHRITVSGRFSFTVE